MVSRRDFIFKTGQFTLASSLFSSTVLSAKAGTKEYIRSKYSGKKLKVLYPKGSLPNVSTVAELFTKETGVSIKLQEASLNEISSELIISTKIRGPSEGIDVALPPSFSVPDLAEGNVIVDLSEFHRKFMSNEYTDGHLYPLGDFYKGRPYGYQTDGDTYLMFYNKEWMESKKEKAAFKKKFGRELSVPKTWRELDQMVEFFHRPNAGMFGGNLFRNKNYILWEYWSRLHSKGLYPVDKSFRPQFHLQGGIDALNEMLAVSKFLDPRSMKDGLFENFKSFAEGKSFCNIGWGGSQKFFNRYGSKVKNKLIFSSLPGGDFKGKTISMPYFNWGWNYVVSKQSTQPELAYLFCLYSTEVSASTHAVRQRDGYFDPFRKEHYEDAAIKETYGNEFLQAHKKSMEGSIPDFYVRGQGQYFAALTNGIYAALQGQLESREALVLVARKWEALTENFGREEQVKQFEFLKKSYPKAIGEVLK